MTAVLRDYIDTVLRDSIADWTDAELPSDQPDVLVTRLATWVPVTLETAIDMGHEPTPAEARYLALREARLRAYECSWPGRRARFFNGVHSLVSGVRHAIAKAIEPHDHCHSSYCDDCGRDR